MNNNVLDSYAICCNKLEKIALKRKVYGPDTNLKSTKKDSKLNDSHKEAKRRNKTTPFICTKSASKSHHMGVNLQTTMSLIKGFRSKSFGVQNYATYLPNKLIASSSNKNSVTSLSQQFSEIQTCPVRSGERYLTEEDEIDMLFIDKPNPWAVKQTDENTNVYECGHQKNFCFCPDRTLENYHKVCTPFMKNLKRKQKLFKKETQNPYIKAKNVQYYELLSRRTQELQQTIATMKTHFRKLCEKYTKLNEQHVRNQNGSLTAILLKTEDEIDVLRSRLCETLNLYHEVVTVKAQEESDSSDDLLDNDKRKPKETTSTRLVKTLRRVQTLQEKLKASYHLQGSGDQVQ